MDNMKIPIIGVGDLKYDENGILRIPFSHADYGEHNHVERICYGCGETFEQGKLKEVNIPYIDRFKHSESDRVYIDNSKLYNYSIFYCKKCWFQNPISDASKWS